MSGRENTVEVVVISVDGRSYALAPGHVVDVLRLAAVTPAPHAPEWAAGVVNLRGTLVPMIDLRPRFGAARTDPDPNHVFLVAETRGRTAAILANCVEDVVQVPSSAIDPPPHTVGSGAIVGRLARSAEGAIVIPDLERLLDGLEPGDWGGREEPGKELHDRNETLCFNAVTEHLAELVPIVYDPASATSSP